MNAIAIVAYRNPIEEWLWESGTAYYMILAFVVLVIGALAYRWFTDRRK